MCLCAAQSVTLCMRVCRGVQVSVSCTVCFVAFRTESVPLSIGFRSQNTCNLISYVMRASLPLSPLSPILCRCQWCRRPLGGAGAAAALHGKGRSLRCSTTHCSRMCDWSPQLNSCTVCISVPALVCTSQEGKKAGVQQQLVRR